MATLCFWIMALVPGVVFPLLLVAYARRFAHRKELIRSLLTNSNAIPEYSLAFRASSDLYGPEWNRRLDLDIESYAYPTVLCSIFSIAAMVTLISASGGNALGLPSAVFEYARRTPPAALAGFAGAYLWAIFDFTDRFRILNLPTNVLHSMWFRMVLAPVAATLATVVLDASFKPMIGFAIGMLPVATVLSWVQDVARQRLSLSATKDVQPLWEHIQGMTPDIVSRLVEAGVTSASHLANQDPVNLLRRTNIDWDNVLDMMDQAILLVYVGPAIERLRVIGIRGAIEAAALYEGISRETGAAVETHATLTAFAEIVGIKPLVAWNLLHNLADDPQVRMLWSLWFDRAAPTQEDRKRPEDARPGSHPPHLLPPAEATVLTEDSENPLKKTA